MAEIWVSAGIGAVGAIGGAAISSSGSKSAAKKSKKAAQAALDEQRRQYDLTRGDYAPYREAGTRALGQLETENGRMPTADEVMSDPGYQFGLDQGQKALDRKRAAMGGRLSGAALTGASQFATNYATTGYGAAYQRRQDRLNRLAALAGIGQTATGGSAAAGARAADSISGLMERQGDVAGANSIAQGNIWGDATNQIAAIGKKWATTPSSSANTDDYRGSELPYSLRGGG